MGADFSPVEWDGLLEADLRELVRLALREDLGERGDLTTAAVVDPARSGAAEVVSRQAGVAAGVLAVRVVLEEAGADASWSPAVEDGASLEPGDRLGRLEGVAPALLTCERVALNLLGRLCGVASLTRRYVEAVAGSGAEVYDTRKTTPGWRRIEKFAVRCGGGRNHRTGLFDAVMIKDNHLAHAGQQGLTLAGSVLLAREAERAAGRPDTVIEVEVDTLEQLAEALSAGPDLVLLDNMSCDQLRQAVALRDASAQGVVLEASGGVRLETIGPIAQTGVERISVGALTHSAVGLDIGLDWIRG